MVPKNPDDPASHMILGYKVGGLYYVSDPFEFSDGRCSNLLCASKHYDLDVCGTRGCFLQSCGVCRQWDREAGVSVAFGVMG